jgi:hypothetical protein
MKQHSAALSAYNPSHPAMSSNSSIGSCISLFDDDESLGKICFDFDTFPTNPLLRDDDANAARKTHRLSQAWCTSSSSSCCSLCRLPAHVSEAGDDIDNDVVNGLNGNNVAAIDVPVFARGFSTLVRPSSNQYPSLVPLPFDDDVDSLSPLIEFRRLCLSDGYRTLMESDDIIPIKSIAIPRDCISDVDNNNSYAPDCQDLKPQATGPDRLTTSYLPDDALAHILSFLSVPSLLKVRCANFKMRAASSKNNAGWKDHCVNLWSRKVGVCEEARELFDRATKMMLKATDAEEERDPTSSTDDFKNVAFSSSADKSDESPPTHLRIARASPTIEQDTLSMEAYKFSVLDAKHRQEVTLNDLCFDADHNKSGIVWSFRFKESAGSDWTSWGELFANAYDIS